MGLKKQLKKLQSGSKKKLGKVRKKLVQTIVGNSDLMQSFLDKVSQDELLSVNFVAAVINNDKLYSMIKGMIAKENSRAKPPSIKYYGPPNEDFPSGGRTRYNFFLAHGASKRVASALNIAEVTPYQLFVMSQKDILETDGLGPATAEFARNLREQLSRQTITNIPE